MRPASLLLAIGLFCLPLPALAAENDRDGDGILDSNEEILGSDPDRADQFRLILDEGVEREAARRRPSYDATKDFTTVEFCHAGGNRYLWRVTFAAPPRASDTVLHLYVDADANPETGRKSTPGGPVHGTDYMLSVVEGRGTSQQFTPDGHSSPGPVVTFVVQDRSIILSADVELGRNAQGVAYTLYVLCHSISKDKHSPTMSDSSRRVKVTGIPLVNRPKIIRPLDHTENFNVLATYGIQRLHQILLGQGEPGGAPRSAAVPGVRGGLADLESLSRTSGARPATPARGPRPRRRAATTWAS